LLPLGAVLTLLGVIALPDQERFDGRGMRRY
jgi:hypothetical protein